MMPNMATTSLPDPSLTIIQDATCTMCGCMCDDIELTVKENRITKAERACELGKPWFLNRGVDDRPSCSIDGQPATVADGVERAAQILVAARYPLIYGLGGATCEAQRLAVGIADWIGGTVDSTTGIWHGPIGVAFHGVGEVTGSLGEIANRGDFILFWGANPAETHPRHFERYSLLPKGMFLPGGRHDRTAVLVDVRRTATAAAMDLFYQVKPHADFEALWILRALAKGLPLETDKVLEDTGIELARWQELMDRMKAARFGVILFGPGLSMTPGRHLNAEAVFALVKDLNAHTRFIARPMRRKGNLAGADNVLTWQTGYPFGVNLARGYPRFNPGEYTAAEMLSRGEVDAAMIVASDPMAELTQLACNRLRAIPCITLDSEETSTTRAAAVAFTTATNGIHSAGTVYRMDDVPIPLRSVLPSTHPSDCEILTQIEQRVRKLGRSGTAGKPRR